MRRRSARHLAVVLAALGLAVFGIARLTSSDPAPVPPRASGPSATAVPPVAPSAAAVPSPASFPVLLVHGYGGTPAELATLAARLRAGGRQVVPVTLPDRGTVDLATSVSALHAAAVRTGASRVDVVGYSLGGVVARAWAMGPGRLVAHTVVQVAAPNGGVVLSPYRVRGRDVPCDDRHACGQLRPGSRYLASLARMQWPDRVGIVSIWSRSDRLVPPESARLAWAMNVDLQRKCPGNDAGHLAIRDDAAVIGAVVVTLTPGAPSPLSYPCALLQREGRPDAAPVPVAIGDGRGPGSRRR